MSGLRRHIEARLARSDLNPRAGLPAGASSCKVPSPLSLTPALFLPHPSAAYDHTTCRLAQSFVLVRTVEAQA